MAEAWMCPRCATYNAPWMAYCLCKQAPPLSEEEKKAKEKAKWGELMPLTEDEVKFLDRNQEKNIALMERIVSAKGLFLENDE